MESTPKTLKQALEATRDLAASALNHVAGSQEEHSESSCQANSAASVSIESSEQRRDRTALAAPPLIVLGGSRGLKSQQHSAQQ